jgi:hypothetical protein
MKATLNAIPKLMNDNLIGYDIDESDIEKVVDALKVLDPKNAAPELAMHYLAFLKTNLREHGDETSLEDLKAQLETFKKSRNKESE